MSSYKRMDLKRASELVKNTAMMSRGGADVAATVEELGGNVREPDLQHQEQEKQWIPAHVKMRVCSRFVVDAPRDTGLQREPTRLDIKKKASTKVHMCKCGYSEEEHTPIARGNRGDPSEDWRMSSHTKPGQTDAFGEIEFSGYGSNMAKYVRVAQDQDMGTMKDLLLDQWQLQPPNLLISVTGGAKNFNMAPRLKTIFHRGLMKVSQSTGAWIITGGTNAGVMKYVGEAAKASGIASAKDRLVTIGIASWGIIQDKECLVSKTEGLWPASYKAEGNVKCEAPLDINHSHFILVDNGTQHQFAVEIDFRGKLERAISQMRTNSADKSTVGVTVPIVQLVLEGGPGTLETCHSAIHNGTPVVVVAGSGRAANILAYACSAAKMEDIEVTNEYSQKEMRKVVIIDENLKLEISRLVKDEWGEGKLQQRVQWVLDCISKPKLISVYSMDKSSVDIDLAILQALFKAGKYQLLDQLKLALSWNRIDVARSELFTENNKWESKHLCEVMHTAIQQDKVEFVKLFLENGVSLKEYLTYRRLLGLYNNNPHRLLRSLLEKEQCADHDSFCFHDVGDVIQELMGDFYVPLYLSEARYSDLDSDYVLSGVTRQTKRSSSKSNRGKINNNKVDCAVLVNEQGGAPPVGEEAFLQAVAKNSSQKQQAVFDDPARELFLWSVMMNRKEMALLFWEELKEAIAPALVASKLLKSMSDKTDDTELKESIAKLASEFEEQAVGVLTKCYLADEKRAQLLLIRELKQWGQTTAILIAVEADNKAFVSHSCCQNLLNDIWMGKMSSLTNSWRMWACILCPPLIFALIKYREDEKSKDQLRQEHNQKKAAKTVKGHGKSNGHAIENMSRTSMAPTESSNEKRHPVERQETYKARNKGLDIQNSGKRLTWYQRIGFFYNAPVITFIHNCISYFIFLALMSYVLLSDFRENISIIECILIVWVFTLFAEELRQLLTVESSNFKLKLTTYIFDPWNILDVITITLFLTGIILRLIPPSECLDCFEAARIILAIDLMTFYFRILRVFSVNKYLGPKLVMIGRMMQDLLSFIFILLVFVAAYGTAIQAILYPNSQISFSLISGVLKKSYFQMFGELFLEEIEGEAECSFDESLYLNGTLARCPANTWVPPVLLGLYILFTNILMFNLLIAMFSYTFEHIQDKTEQYWHFMRYKLVAEYYEHPPLVAPVVIFAHLFLMLRVCYYKCCSKEKPVSSSGFKMTFGEANEERQLILWENMNAEEFLRRAEYLEGQTTENRVAVAKDTITDLSSQFEDFAENGPKAGISPQLHDRLAQLEQQMLHTTKALEFIMKSLIEKNMGSSSIKPPELKDYEKEAQKEEELRQEQLQQERKKIEETIQRLSELHFQARMSPYPGTSIPRYEVSDDRVSWSVEYDGYEPVMYTSQYILTKPYFADEDLLDQKYNAGTRPKLPFNSMDQNQEVNRVSFLGTYEVVDGLPKNPKGRTGIIGRGLLGRWGVNHAVDPIVTRWRKDADGKFVIQGGKRVLEFIAVQRADNQKWSIPGAIVEPGKHLGSTILQILDRKVLEANFEDGEVDAQERKLQEFLQDGNVVYEGYADDPRNTDNAWIETTAVNYHDDTGDVLDQIEFHTGVSSLAVAWRSVANENYHGNHTVLLKMVAHKRDTDF